MLKFHILVTLLMFIFSIGAFRHSNLHPLSQGINSYYKQYQWSRNLKIMSRMLNTNIDEMPGYLRGNEIVYTNDASADNVSEEWELDCYSRPVLNEDGKKVWEVLVTDSQGSFRYLKTLPSNLVNSRNLRKVVEELIDEAPVRPRVVRFFRNQMYNMITIALSTLEVEVKPSRCTDQLFIWLEEREKNIYPNMKGMFSLYLDIFIMMNNHMD